MKSPAPTVWLRQALVLSALALLFTGSYWLASSTAGAARFGGLSRVGAGATGKFANSYESEAGENEPEQAEEEENDADRPRPDQPDQAQAQDAALTRDPATGTIPRERLLGAASFNERALAERTRLRGSSTATLADAVWAERGPTNVAGRLRALLVDPADPSGNTLWAGTAGGGLWKCTGATTPTYQWTNVNSFLTNLAVSTVVAVPGTSPEVLYCGTGEGYFNADAIQGAGVWKSGDGGATWAQLPGTNNANFYYVQQLVVHPITKDVYAATRTGLWRSQNGGTTWSLVLGLSTTPASATNRVADLQVAADGTLFAAFGIFNTDGIYRSTTGNVGAWTKLNSVANSGLPTTGYQRIALACAPSDANRLYAVFQSAASGTPLLDVYRSADKGDTWVALSKPGATTANPTFDYTRGQAWYGLAAAVSPADPNAVYVGGIDLWLTTDAGNAKPETIVWDQESSWTLPASNSGYVHADQHFIAFVPTRTAPANRAFFGSDGGVAYSANASISTAGSPTFSQTNTGLNVTQFYSVAAHPTNLNYFLAGAQDNGTARFSSAGLNATTRASGGDGGFCAIDQANPNVQITSYVYNQYYRTLDGGTSGFKSFAFSNSTGSFINPWDYDGRAGVLYAGNTNGTYFAWTDASLPMATTIATATTITPSLIPAMGAGVGSVTHVRVSPQKAGRVYFGTNGGRLLRVEDAATATPTVTTLFTAPNTGTSVSCVAVDPANEQHLLLTLSNYGIISVYETTTADAPTPTWTAVEGNLPDMPVRWALFDPANPARALLATEMGVYSTERLSGATTTWAPATGLVNVRVDMLRYRPADQLVVAATHGRGLFTSALLQNSPLAARPATGASAPGLLAAAYPNPLGPTLTLELSQAPVGEVGLRLLDALGRAVWTTSRPASAGQRLSLAVPAGLAPGTYQLLVRANGQEARRAVAVK